MSDFIGSGGTANDLDTLNGLFKETYAKRMEVLIPDGVRILNKIDFARREQQPGNLYHQPVVLGLEHGVTFGGAGDGAFALEPAIAGTIRDATVRGNQMVLRSVLSYSAAARSVGAEPKAFEDSTKFLVGNMMRSMAKKLEIEMLYGGVGYSVIDSVSTNDLTMEAAEWAPGIWSGAEGLVIDVRTGLAGASRGTATVTAVDMETLTVSVDSAPAGTASGDAIYHKGAFGNEFAGIHQILTNTGSLFGIDASTYSLWKGNEVDAAAANLSFALIQKAVAKAVEKGLDEAVYVLVNTDQWNDLLDEQTTVRRYDSSYTARVAEAGHESLKFFGQNGMIEIVPSIYVKRGYTYVLAIKDWIRIGSTDITFNRPGQGDKFFRDLNDAAGYELRAYTDQAIFSHSPGRNTLIKNLTTS